MKFLCKSGLSKGFGCFSVQQKVLGQRFFKQLVEHLVDRSLPLCKRPSVILFNISAPLTEIVREKIRGQKVVLRVDGLYFDKLNEEFLSRFIPPVASFLRAVYSLPCLQELACNFANFLDRNFAPFLRICLADHVIYQSRFAQRLYQGYFPTKTIQLY